MFTKGDESSEHSEDDRRAQAADATGLWWLMNGRGAVVTEEARLLTSMAARTEREAERNATEAAEEQEGKRNMAHGTVGRRVSQDTGGGGLRAGSRQDRGARTAGG